MSEHPEIKHKLVSVIIPTYNTARYIVQTVQSVVEQQYQNWELIIVDDGSTDNTQSLISAFLSDPRITYFKKENGGVSRARNYGAELAKGDYLCFLDADDLFYPANLSEKAAILDRDPEVGMVHADVNRIDGNGAALGSSDTGLSGKNLHLDILLWNECVIPATSSVMLRKEVFYSVGQWDPAFSTAADQDLFIRVASRYKIERIKHPLTAYRILSGSMSKNAAVFEKDHIGVYLKAEKNNLFPSHRFQRRSFSKLYLIIAGTWWNLKNYRSRSIKYLLLALMQNPFSIFELAKKLRR